MLRNSRVLTPICDGVGALIDVWILYGGLMRCVNLSKACINLFHLNLMRTGAKTTYATVIFFHQTLPIKSPALQELS